MARDLRRDQLRTQTKLTIRQQNIGVKQSKEDRRAAQRGQTERLGAQRDIALIGQGIQPSGGTGGTGGSDVVREQIVAPQGKTSRQRRTSSRAASALLSREKKAEGIRRVPGLGDTTPRQRFDLTRQTQAATRRHFADRTAAGRPPSATIQVGKQDKPVTFRGSELLEHRLGLLTPQTAAKQKELLGQGERFQARAAATPLPQPAVSGSEQSARDAIARQDFRTNNAAAIEEEIQRQIMENPLQGQPNARTLDDITRDVSARFEQIRLRAAGEQVGIDAAGAGTVNDISNEILGLNQGLTGQQQANVAQNLQRFELQAGPPASQPLGVALQPASPERSAAFQTAAAQPVAPVAPPAVAAGPPAPTPQPQVAQPDRLAGVRGALPGGTAQAGAAGGFARLPERPVNELQRAQTAELQQRTASVQRQEELAARTETTPGRTANIEASATQVPAAIVSPAFGGLPTVMAANRTSLEGVQSALATAQTPDERELLAGKIRNQGWYTSMVGNLAELKRDIATWDFRDRFFSYPFDKAGAIEVAASLDAIVNALTEAGQTIGAARGAVRGPV